MKRRLLAGGIVVAVVVLIATLSWHHASQPAQVFNGMLRNNLATSGVTREVSQTANGLTLRQLTQVNFGTNPTAHALTIFSQNGGHIETEEISNPTNDLVRYRAITSKRPRSDGKPLDTSSVVGKWAKLGAGDSFSSALSSGLFGQTVQGIVPLANLTPTERHQILQFINENDIFAYNAATVKHVRIGGRSAYQYDVSIKPAPYVALMQRYGKLLGATAYKNLDPNTYSGAPAINIVASVDVSSRHLLQITQTASKRTEKYSGYGVAVQTVIPKASLTTAELTKRIGSLR